MRNVRHLSIPSCTSFRLTSLPCLADSDVAEELRRFRIQNIEPVAVALLSFLDARTIFERYLAILQVHSHLGYGRQFLLSLDRTVGCDNLATNGSGILCRIRDSDASEENHGESRQCTTNLKNRSTTILRISARLLYLGSCFPFQGTGTDSTSTPIEPQGAVLIHSGETDSLHFFLPYKPRNQGAGASVIGLRHSLRLQFS